jgi:hypothetical protein
MQLWKLDDNKKLRNKAGFWISTDDWSLLKPGTGNSIEILKLNQTKACSADGKVLHILKDSLVTILHFLSC